MGDYSASQHMRLDAIGSTGDYPPDIWHYPRYKLITTCHAYGLDPMTVPRRFQRLSRAANRGQKRSHPGHVRQGDPPQPGRTLHSAFAPSVGYCPSAQTTSRFCRSSCQWPRCHRSGRCDGRCRQHTVGPTGSSRALRAVTDASP